ncbi:MAG: hypothetical protein ACK4UJ_06275 [Leptonema sp. (in: bacteria)]
MLSIKEGFYSFFFPEKAIEDNIEKIFFYYDIYTSNFSRIYYATFVLIIGLSGILIFDLIRYLENELEGPAKELAITHIVFFITNLFFIFPLYG